MKRVEFEMTRMTNGLPPSDLTDEERDQLRGLRKRKMDLLEEIEMIKNEVTLAFLFYYIFSCAKLIVNWSLCIIWMIVVNHVLKLLLMVRLKPWSRMLV